MNSPSPIWNAATVERRSDPDEAPFGSTGEATVQFLLYAGRWANTPSAAPSWKRTFSTGTQMVARAPQIVVLPELWYSPEVSARTIGAAMSCPKARVSPV